MRNGPLQPLSPVLLAILLGAAWPPPARSSGIFPRGAGGPVVAEQHIDLPRPAELNARITTECGDCSWETEGREAVTFTIWLDGRYSQHLPLVRGAHGEYKVLLGHAEAGRHSIRIEIDPDTTARQLRRDGAASARLVVTPVFSDAPDYLAMSLTPFLYARANTIGRFTDVPVFMWYESEATSKGTRYRYSVIFTNEDGGTPADRLMATWGRTTDIEFIYSVEVDRAGTILAEEYQGPDHQVLPFHGQRAGRHPLLWVVTDNNMVRDAGDTRIRFAPAPRAARLAGRSREVLMDANPWLYAVMAQELKREGKIDDEAPPGRGVIPDPRRFVYLEACGELGNLALGFAVGTSGNETGRYEWVSSDRGVPAYRIVRSGCVRAAIPLGAGAHARDLRALRALAFERPPSRNGTPTRPGTVRLTRVNTLFMLDDQFVPGPSMLEWRGSATIRPDGPPLELAIRVPSQRRK